MVSSITKKKTQAQVLLFYVVLVFFLMGKKKLKSPKCNIFYTESVITHELSDLRCKPFSMASSCLFTTTNGSDCFDVHNVECELVVHMLVISETGIIDGWFP